MAMIEDLDTSKASVNDLIERVDFTARRFQDRDNGDTNKVIMDALAYLLRRDAQRRS